MPKWPNPWILRYVQIHHISGFWRYLRYPGDLSRWWYGGVDIMDIHMEMPKGLSWGVWDTVWHPRDHGIAAHAPEGPRIGSGIGAYVDIQA